ncbi:MAG: transglycosylase SLT domain-containing protein [Proteobacteria bacterium]|nr:transglycosylase SLT domain-containing protein [Pseudomonadota bacterium]
MTSKNRILFLLALFALGVAHADETFPIPTELQPDVAFWVNIFTRYSSDQGVLHDDRHLEIVYERIDFPAGLDRRARQRIVKKKREQLRNVLRSLASGKRDNLDANELKVLALWPPGVSNQTLSAATRRVRYQQGLEDRFQQGLIRAGRWRDYIEKEFLDLGVPIELAALPHVESSYNPHARSHVGASGIWQFTRSTGRRYMRIDHVLDERNDPFVATQAAGKLLAYNYSITRNWPMAITAYNHGLAGVRRAMRKHGDTAYADIIRNYNGRTFGFASRNFYVAFLAAKQVDQNVEQYFPDIVVDQPIDFANVTLQAYIPVIDLTNALGVTPAQLAIHNPALQATVWQGSKHLPKGFRIRLPSNLLDGPIADFMAKVPADRWQPKQLPDMFHTIARGDTLSEIARAYDTRVSTLVALNNLGSSHRIRAGQKLRLPAAGPAPGNQVKGSTQPAPIEPPIVASATSAVGESSAFDEFTSSIMAGDLVASLLGTIQTALLSDPSDYSIAPDTTIEVHPLETLGHYADWLGIRTQRLRDINGLAFRTPVVVGKRIRLELASVDAKTFEDRRIAYHAAQQDGFFRKNIITGVTQHVIRSGESIWILSLRKYDVPVWLFRQYNPELDLHNVRPGIVVHFPVLASGSRP